MLLVSSIESGCSWPRMLSRLMSTPTKSQEDDKYRVKTFISQDTTVDCDYHQAWIDHAELNLYSNTITTILLRGNAQQRRRTRERNGWICYYYFCSRSTLIHSLGYLLLLLLRWNWPMKCKQFASCNNSNKNHFYFIDKYATSTSHTALI